MKRNLTALVLLIFVSGAGAFARTTAATTQQAPASPQATDPSVNPNGAIGEVKAIDAAAKQMIIKTDGGALVTVTLGDKTTYLRLAPGEKTLTNATKIAFVDVAEGDRVWARGKVSDDHKSVPAVALVVMTKADIASKQERERAEWRKRGILGVITGLKPETKEITISTRSLAGTQVVMIPVSGKADVRRYAPDSIKFSDAKPSVFEELKLGDQLRALGDRSADGTHFTPERIVTGAFRTVAGTVTAIDAATGEIKINNLQTKQPLTIVVKNDAVLRKFPAASELGGAMMMGGPRFGGGPPGAQPEAGAKRAEQSPGSSPSAQGGLGAGGGMRIGGGGGGIQEMLERLPEIAMADVKVGDTIIVSSTQGADPTRLTAITLVSGADTLLNLMAARQQQAGGQARQNSNPMGDLGSGMSFGIGLP